MPDTPKTAAILTVAQHLVAAAAASGDNIPIAMPIQAPEPSPVQPETPIIKLSDDTFKSTPVGSAITINDSPSGKTRSKVSAAAGGAGGVASLSNSSPSTRPSTGKNKSVSITFSPLPLLSSLSPSLPLLPLLSVSPPPA